jgi:fluoride exporter
VKLLLLAGLGGFIGSAARYALGLALLHRPTLLTFPLATLLVNVTGSFLIGLLAGSGATRSWLVDDVRVFLLVGILGGFTTFSSFSYDTLDLWRESGAARAALNVTLNVVLCLFAVWLGDAASRG